MIRSLRWQRYAGWSLVGIAVAHVVYFVIDTQRSWSGWLAGNLRGVSDAEVASTQALTRSAMDFWALPGGFAIPLALLGLVVVEMARREMPTPTYVGLGILLWCAVGTAIWFPSGFVLGLIPAVLLFMARRYAKMAI